MKPVAFEYARAADVEEALRLLAQAGDGARPISGGQSLGPMLNLRVVTPILLVDISEIRELTAVRSEDGYLTLGAATTHARVEDGLGNGETQGLLPRIASGIAYRPVRNRGTMGGSLAHADPGADWPPVLFALGAEVEVRGPEGRRWIGVDDLIAGALSSVLDPNEIISAIRIPELAGGARWGHCKFCRKPGDFAASIATVVIDPERRIARAVLASGTGASGRLAATERWLNRGGKGGEGLDKALSEDIKERANAELWSEHATALHRAMMTKALREALA